MNERRRPQIGGHGEKLTRKQEAAIAALLAEPTLERAADVTGVAESTLRRWLQRPDFADRYREARQALVDNAVRDLQRACGEAARVLRDVATNPETPATARVAACKAILEQTYKGLEVFDLAERIAKLETSIDKGAWHERRAATA